MLQSLNNLETWKQTKLYEDIPVNFNANENKKCSELLSTSTITTEKKLQKSGMALINCNLAKTLHVDTKIK
jgi:hypothetical protein